MTTKSLDKLAERLDELLSHAADEYDKYRRAARDLETARQDVNNAKLGLEMATQRLRQVVAYAEDVAA